MKSLSTRLSGRTRRMCLVLGGLGLAGLLAACASQPGVGDTPTEFQTASDESPARARARTRLALASGYFENGQHVVALDEQKKAVQADPTFADAYNLGGLIYMALGDNALEAFISRLRKKIEPDPHEPAIIKTVYGAGYLFAADVSWE